ncbi:uncharacterized protein VP01_6418g1 [Puccinia sorghi]|uniref:Tf2-1-like SH3-like domain-containing protein n=1 Tax=Puccinia sorghi TaxID=27349 RepID=A0A0L6UHY5_9BASI|nr:uncharacterized protein VP01_6418g1 [Puccinia sorghi]
MDMMPSWSSIVFLIILLVIVVHCLCPLFGPPFGRNPIFESIHVSPSTPAANYLLNIKQLQEQLRQRYKQQADKLCLQPPSFNIGYSFWPDTCKIQTTRPTPKLSERKLGPFKIESVVSKNAFKLSLPLKWKTSIHPVFHVFLLEPAKGLYPGKTHPPPEPANYNISSNGLVISLTKIKLPGNPPTIFETPLTWFKTFIYPTLTNLINLKSPSFQIFKQSF